MNVKPSNSPVLEHDLSTFCTFACLEAQIEESNEISSTLLLLITPQYKETARWIDCIHCHRGIGGMVEVKNHDCCSTLCVIISNACTYLHDEHSPVTLLSLHKVQSM